MPLFDPRITNAVIAIGHKENGFFSGSASGFFYGYMYPDDQIEGNLNLQVFLVTNYHVIKDLDSITIRVNDRTGIGTKLYDVPLFTAKGERLFEFNEAIDLAVVTMELPPWSRGELGRTIIAAPESLTTIKHFDALNVSEADSIYVLGYPLGLVDYDVNFPLFRNGIISRIGDYLTRNSETFVIDSQIYPGNSGGPVFLEPRPFMKDENFQLHKPGMQFAYLIGVVSGYIPYRETAVSSQTGKPRIQFEENSGLGVVIPSPHIIDLILKHNDYRIGLSAKFVKYPVPDFDKP